jgi:hypothetical protein
MNDDSQDMILIMRISARDNWNHYSGCVDLEIQAREIDINEMEIVLLNVL